MIRPVNHSPIAITGYTDRLSVRPGSSLSVHASSTHSSGSMRLVRLDHDGTTYTSEQITPPVPVELAHRDMLLGSYGIVGRVDLPEAPLCLQVWAQVTRLPSGEAVLLAVDGLALTVDASGIAVLTAGGRRVGSPAPLQLRSWYHLTGGLDAERRPFLAVGRAPSVFGDPRAGRSVATEAVEWTAHTSELVLGRGLDGKLEDGAVGRMPGEDVLRLDFARGISTWLLHDDRGDVVGRVEGLPTRAVRGRRWDGSCRDWRNAPEQYAAIHFHTDDQGDQQWPVTATVDVPHDLPTGMYAVELHAGEDADHLPFTVRRGRGGAAPLLVLIPTMTYLAYTIEHHTEEFTDKEMGWRIRVREVAAEFAWANGMHSWYDEHADGSPVVLASIRRPMLAMRADHRYRFPGCDHGLSADLHLLGWLRRQGFTFDLATDHDLDAEGAELLAPYRGVLTGHHPEYWTGRMLDGLLAYLGDGGSLAYLGGNGFFKAVTVDPNDPSVAECRKGAGWMQHDVHVGEDHFQLSGLPAGFWSTCGHPTAPYLGVTWSCMGTVQGAPFRRTPASFDPRVAHLFEGIGADELLGENGSILGAAASFEVDFADPRVGTPAHALVVATAQMPDGYGWGPVYATLSDVGSPRGSNPNRADVVYCETAAGGAVFSSGSMGWVGALSHNGDNNAVSTLTANVLRSFIESRQPSA